MPTGFRVLQVAALLALGLARCFEICERFAEAEVLKGEPTAMPRPARDLTLRLSVGDRPGSKLVVGHELVSAPAAELAEWLKRVALLPISIAPAAPGYLTADGVRIHVAVLSGQAEATFKWEQHDVPPQWFELAKFAKGFLQQCEAWLGTG